MATEKLASIHPLRSGPDPVRTVLAPIVGRVIGVDPLEIDRGEGDVEVRRAASCLIAPRVGDEVLLQPLADGRLYVLAVLERESDVLELDVDRALCIRGGDLELDAKQLRIRGEDLRVAARRSLWATEQFQLVAEELSTSATRQHQAATVLERVVETAKETLGTSFRRIERAEHIHAGSLAITLREAMRVHSETAVWTAKKIFKLASEQIHFG